VHIRSLIQDRENDRWIVMDGEGAVCTVSQPSGEVKTERVIEFNAGGIVGLATCPWAHFAVTAGSDGSVRMYDYRKKEAQMYSKRFDQPATVLMMMPESVDESQRVVVVGFADGIVRALLRGKSEWKLMAVMKPHKQAVTSIAVSPDGKMMASASKDGSVFFFAVQDAISYIPLAFTVVQVGSLAPLYLKITRRSNLTAAFLSHVKFEGVENRQWV
jgi:WD40 repeat protein